MRYEAVFFDLDGTVIDTLQNITDAVNHTMRRFGLRTFTAEELRPHLGWGVDYLMRTLIPDISEARIAEILGCTMAALYALPKADDVPELTPEEEELAPDNEDTQKEDI